jgi:hypothetical protein
LRPQVTLAPPALARTPSDEQVLVQNILFCTATRESRAGAEFVHIGGYACARSTQANYAS